MLHVLIGHDATQHRLLPGQDLYLNVQVGYCEVSSFQDLEIT